MTTGKTITLTRWTFVGKVMSLLFNMLSGLVIAFLPRVRVIEPQSLLYSGEPIVKTSQLTIHSTGRNLGDPSAISPQPQIMLCSSTSSGGFGKVCAESLFGVVPLGGHHGIKRAKAMDPMCPSRPSSIPHALKLY